MNQHAPIADIFAGPAYYLPRDEAPQQAIRITPTNAHLLEQHLPYTKRWLSERIPVFLIVVEGEAIAACYSARQTAKAAEAGVDTLEQYRGRGYAIATTQNWAAAVYAAGKLPLYSTSWDNLASQTVAQKLKAVQYAVTYSVT
ncbi:MAG: GNAT family N-acetyltransferase [Anaerolineae bacterium]|nr:GNAT family N-acetyltransferase [Anaerolineae bacterium]